MNLSPRLLLAAQLCSGAAQTIDVGCDHAQLSLYLVGQGARHAYASDLRPGPLEQAKRNIRAAGMEAGVTPVLRRGLAGFSPADCDTVVICGMGGELIAEILQDAPWTRDGQHRLVLQPMTCAHRLRRWLAENGYTVQDERLAREGQRLYSVLCAKGGAPAEGEENAYLFTRYLLDDPLFPLFAERLREKYRRAAAARRQAGLDTAQEDAVLLRLEECCHVHG